MHIDLNNSLHNLKFIFNHLLQSPGIELFHEVTVTYGNMNKKNNILCHCSIFIVTSDLEC